MLHAASQDLPACARSASTARRSSTPSSPRGCSGTRASGSAPSSRRPSASSSPRSTRPPTGRPGRSPSPGSNTPRWMSNTSSTCATRSWPSSRSRARPSRRAGVPAVLDGSRSRAARTRGGGCAACTPCAGARRSPSRASSGRHARPSRRSRTSPPAGWSPTAPSSPPCLADPKSKQELAALKEFTGRASRSQLDRWWAAIEAGRASDDLPLERASAATRCRRPARGATATRRPTRG